MIPNLGYNFLEVLTYSVCFCQLAKLLKAGVKMFIFRYFDKVGSYDNIYF